MPYGLDWACAVVSVWPVFTDYASARLQTADPGTAGAESGDYWKKRRTE